MMQITSIIDEYWSHIEYLEFSGGGIDALCSLGAISHIKQNYDFSFLKQIRGISGTSAGATIGAFLVMSKFKVNQLIDDIFTLPWETLVLLTTENIQNFFDNLGLLSRKKTSSVYLDPIISKYCDGNVDITLQEFTTMFNVQIAIRVTNLTTGNIVWLTNETFPNFKLKNALWASMALPGILEPHLCEDGSFYVDGGLHSNYIIDYFDAEKTHGFKVNTRYNYYMSSLTPMLAAFAKDKSNDVPISTIRNVIAHIAMWICSISTIVVKNFIQSPKQFNVRSTNIKSLEKMTDFCSGAFTSVNLHRDVILQNGVDCMKEWEHRLMQLSVFVRILIASINNTQTIHSSTSPFLMED
jgi:predicted acylesterase/phospholipase RssA